MEKYLDTVENILLEGNYKPNRTSVDTISLFSSHYRINLQKGYPLLTTKKMDGFRWDSMIHELLWYLSGEEHIRNLSEKTGIWDNWADDEGHLDTSYGRFWRRFPVPEKKGQLSGETWVGEGSDWVYKESSEEESYLVFDQIQYVIDQLRENPKSRRIVVNAWHPANATISTLPPCHYSFVFNVQGDKLNLHTTQRSADIALGVPFNIACYSLILEIIAQHTGFEPGFFSHTLVDSHVYCGSGERGEWYEDNINELQSRIQETQTNNGYLYVKEWIESNAPEESDDANGYDHIPGLLEQLSREPFDRPEIEVNEKPLDELTIDDIGLKNYESYDGIYFKVAE